jgi:hypothetical protein
MYNSSQPALVFAFAVAVALAFLVVIPEGDLLLLLSFPLFVISQRSGEMADLTAFVFAVVFFLRFWPKKRMSSPQTT